jgi:hypothetical protein
MRLLRDIFSKLQWFGIYFFILEVYDVKNKMEAHSIAEYEKLNKVHSLRKLVVYSTIVLFELIQILYEVERKIDLINERDDDII